MSALLIALGAFAYICTLTYSTLHILSPTLLRLAPIVSSTASLVWAWDEHTAFAAWMDPAYRTDADNILPPWFANWAKKGNYVLFTTFPLSMCTGLANVISLTNSSAPAWSSLDSPRLWYALGTFFALAHMFFGKKALGLLAEIRRKGPDGVRGATSTNAMARWLRMHALRTPTTDLPAVLCFLTAANLGLGLVV